MKINELNFDNHNANKHTQKGLRLLEKSLSKLGAGRSSVEFQIFNFNIMTLGYPKSTDTDRILKLEHKGIEIGYGKTEWGAEPNKLYFIIKHGATL